MTTATVLINGDGSWKFRDLLWCHALDLYPIDSGLVFYDTASNAGGGDAPSYRPILGNFPEDYSHDPETLIDEVREEVITSVRDRNRYLSVAITLSKKDFLALATAQSLEKAELSKPGRAALDAMSEAIRLVNDLPDGDERFAAVASRLWFSIVVRDGGAEERDNDLANRAKEKLQFKRAGLHSVFFLSNGRGQDEGPLAEFDQFSKIRLLLDVFMHQAEDSVGSRIRPSMMQRTQRGVRSAHWMRLEDVPLPLLSYGDLVRRTLLTSYDELGVETGDPQDSADEGAFDNAVKELRGSLPALAEETYGQQQAIDAVQVGLKTFRSEEDETIEEIKRDQGDVDDVILGLSRKRFFSDLFFSRKRRIKYEVAGKQYEAAYASTEQDYSVVVAREIDTLRKRMEDRRNDVAAILNKMRLPTGGNGQRKIEAFSSELKLQAGKIGDEISKSRQLLAKNEILGREERKLRKAERKAAMENLLRVEKELLRPLSALAVIAIVEGILLAPLLVNALHALFNYSTLSRSQLFAQMGPVAYIALLTLVVSLAAVVIHARKLARWRDKLRIRVFDMLEHDYDKLKAANGSILSIAINRVHLSLVNQVIERIHPKQKPLQAANTRALMDKLKNQQHTLPALSSVPPERLTQDIRDAFGSKTSTKERIQAFLTAWHIPEMGTLTLTDGPRGDEMASLSCTATKETLSVSLSEAGND